MGQLRKASCTDLQDLLNSLLNLILSNPAFSNQGRLHPKNHGLADHLVGILQDVADAF